jgi:hypothetical protein
MRAVCNLSSPIEVLKLLIETGPDINAGDNQGRNVLMVYLNNHKTYNPEIVKLLIKSGVLIDYNSSVIHLTL